MKNCSSLLGLELIKLNFFLNFVLKFCGNSERYGSELTSEELKEFDVLKADYEINWHLNHLRSVLSPTVEELKSRSTKIKNRRRAYLDKLVSDGQYFSEDAMREREPYLHHEFVGKFQDPSGRSMARPGERWSETLMRRSEEAMLVEKIRGEQQRLGVAERDWVGNERTEQEEMEMEEEEEEEESEEEEEEEEEEIGKKDVREDMKTRVANGTSQNQQVISCVLLNFSLFTSFLSETEYPQDEYFSV